MFIFTFKLLLVPLVLARFSHCQEQQEEVEDIYQAEELYQQPNAMEQGKDKKGGTVRDAVVSR